MEGQRLMALVLDPDSPEKLLNIFLDECYYWKSRTKSPRRIMYYHQNGKVYEAVTILEDFEESKEVHKMKAWRLDYSNYVNVNLISHFDRKNGLAYFKDEQVPPAHIARIHSSILECFMNKEEIISKPISSKRGAFPGN